MSRVEVDVDVRSQFEKHLESFFAGHPREARYLDRGPIAERLQGFHVEVFAPGPRLGDSWMYITCGAASVLGPYPRRCEFLILGLRDNELWLELATTIAYYHAGAESQKFGLGHTVPLGKPLLPGASCDSLLFCFPYPLAPELWRCELSDGTHIQVLWALPITSAERAFNKDHGLDELEDRFEKAGIEYWDMSRRSVV